MLAATVPEKPYAVIPVAPTNTAQRVRAENPQSPLSQNFMNNLRKAYGSKALEKVGTGNGFGYIVE